MSRSLATLLLLFGTGLWAQAQFAVTYKSGSIPTACGQVLSGSFVGAANDHSVYFNANSPLYAYNDAPHPERSYRLVLASPSYVVLEQAGANRHGAIICADSSNASTLCALNYYNKVFLDVGAYYINIEQGFDTTDLAYSFTLRCLGQDTSLYGSAKAFARLLNANDTMRGSLAGETDKLRLYYVEEFDQYWQDRYYPEPDREYAFDLAERRRITVRNNGGTRHKVFLMDTSGSTGHVVPLVINPPSASPSYYNYFDIDQGSMTLDLDPGRYYLSVEQGSSALSDQYDFELSTACVPEIGRLGYLTFEYGVIGATLNGGGAYGEITHSSGAVTTYVDKYYEKAMPLHVGGGNNSLAVNSGPGYVRAFIDLNKDGDFDDAHELLYRMLDKGRPLYNPTWVAGGSYILNNTFIDNFTLPDTAYGAYLGGVYRMRVLVTDTSQGSACGTYRDGMALDVAVRFDTAGARAAGPAWVRQIGDGAVDVLTDVRAMPDGGVTSLSSHAFVAATSFSSYNPFSDIKLTTGAAGDVRHLRLGQGHHYYLAGSSLATHYDRQGNIAWILQVIGNQFNLDASYVDMVGSAVDSTGGLLLAANVYGSAGIVRHGDTASG